jgi:DNA end-binding protein Ku
MRPIWTGAIGFGLVNIPVKVYSATQSSSLDLDMLDKKDHSKIRFQRINERTGKVVNWENIVKGYLVDDRYVVLDNKDFEQASPEKSKTISIINFVKESEIEAVYYETPYYLAPDKSGERAYALLREALIKTGKGGIATFVMRGKENLCLLTARNDVIILNRLRFAEEVRSPEELKLPKKTLLKSGELNMAVSLINQLSEKFRIEKFQNTYTQELLKLIKAKAKGKRIAKPTKLKVVHSRKEDLVDQLKASISRSKRAS